MRVAGCELRVASCELWVAKLETRNPKPETRNPKPETRNPKPETRKKITLQIKIKVMKNYRDLDVFKLSYRLAVDVHKLSMKLPKYELYETGSQIRRSSKSITANIAEGYGRKRYKADFIRFLIYAHASCDETLVHLEFIKDIHNLNTDNLVQDYNKLGGKINNFIKYVEEKWKS